MPHGGARARELLRRRCGHAAKLGAAGQQGDGAVGWQGGRGRAWMCTKGPQLRDYSASGCLKQL
eukprot:12050431-Alexandrium_andersonii.AAC.1